MARVGVAVLVTGYGLEITGNLLEVWVAGANPETVLGGDAHLLTLFGILMELVGASLFGVTLLRRTAVPSLGAGLLAVALPVGIGGAVALVLAGLDEALFFAFTVPIGTALVVLGYHLLSVTETHAEPPMMNDKRSQTG